MTLKIGDLVRVVDSGLKKIRPYTRKPKDPLLTLKKGDVLIAPDGAKRTVLSVKQQVSEKIILSHPDLNSASTEWSIDEIKAFNMRKAYLLTRQQIAKKFGCDINFEIVEEV